MSVRDPDRSPCPSQGKSRSPFHLAAPAPTSGPPSSEASPRGSMNKLMPERGNRSPYHLAAPGPASGPASSRNSSMGSADHDQEVAPVKHDLTEADLLALPDDADTKFDLHEEIGQGTFGLVHRAMEVANGRQVAIKIIENMHENLEEILQEYQILSNHGLHPNIPMIFGIHRVGTNIWMSLELCAGGSVAELARQLIKRGRRLIDDQIAYIIKEVLHALIYLQDNQCLHRDVKGSNILLTDKAEVKLVDYGISCQLSTEEEKRRTRVGTPYWMAPEVILCGDPELIADYDGRCDVWSLGITIIELAEGAPPLSDMQPMRALCQIPRNPPPRLSRPEEWSVALNDVVTETLVKDYDHRPMLQEIIQHPLFRTIPANPTYVQAGLIMLMKWVEKEKNSKKAPDDDKTTDNREMVNRKTQVDAEMIKTENLVNGPLYTQTKKIAEVLKKRQDAGLLYTYSGDLLIAVNPEEIPVGSELPEIEKDEPHLFALVRKIYNKMVQEKKDQVLLTCGMEKSGKKAIYRSALNLLVKLGSHERFENETTQRKILAGSNVLKLFTEYIHGEMMVTVRETNVFFNSSGSISGASFTNYFQEGIIDFSVSCRRLKILKIVPIGLRILGKHREFGLHHFLAEDEEGIDFKECFEDFNTFLHNLQITGFRTDTGVNVVLRVLVAVALIPKLEFEKEGEHFVVHNKAVFVTVANLLEVDEEFLLRALTQTNVIMHGNFFQCQDPKKNAESLASLLYTRLLDWVEDYINCNLKLSLAVYGVKNYVKIIEMAGGADNVGEIGDDFGTLLLNTGNEIIHYLLLKKTIQWEEIEAKNNRLKLRYPVVKGNKSTLDSLLSPSGFLTLLSEAASGKTALHESHLGSQAREHFVSSPDCLLADNILRVNHFWGQGQYNTAKMMARNENFTNPELIQTLAASSDECLRNLFQLPVDCHGKVCFEENQEKTFSQSLAQQTIVSRFRFWLKGLIETFLTKDCHMVMCFDGHSDLIEQVEAFNLKEITYVAKKGFPARLTFADFLRHYCFLAFNYDERVVATRENAQLLMLRLAMDGFECGRRKIFLKFYHINYLTNLYNTQYRRILIVQSAVRRYLAKKRSERQRTARLASKLMTVKTAFSKWRGHKSEVFKQFKERSLVTPLVVSNETKIKAAISIQKHFRGFSVRQKLKIQTRMNVLSLLRSPLPDRKERAENILQEEGLTVHEAKAAVVEISHAIESNMIQAVITNEEMVDIFLKRVFANNIDVHVVMKNCKEGVPMASIAPIPSGYAVPKMAAEELLAFQQAVHNRNSKILPPMKLYNIGNFYTEKGPLEKWDALVEQITFDIGKNIVSSHGHVIKERMQDDSSYKTLDKKKQPADYQVAKVSTMSTKASETKVTNNGMNLAKKKSDIVHHMNKMNAKHVPPKTQLVEQMKQLKRHDGEEQNADMDTDGPYDFRRLLRKTDVLPTNTLRQFRQRSKIPILKPERENILMTAIINLGQNEISL